MKKRLFILSIAAGIMLSACSSLSSDMPKREKADTTPGINLSKKNEDIPDKPEPYELSDDFISSYLDVDSFNNMTKRTQDGIRITQDTAGMSKGEVALWKEIIMSDYYTQYTTDDLEAKMAELYAALADTAAKHKMTEEEYVKSDPIGMEIEEVKKFLKEQAEKFKIEQEENALDKSILTPSPGEDKPEGFDSPRE